MTTQQAASKFAVGTTWQYETRSPWGGKGQRGMQIDRFVFKVTKHLSNQFSYEVVQHLEVVDAMPGPNARQSTSGGMTFAYAEEQLATGILQPSQVSVDGGR